MKELEEVSLESNGSAEKEYAPTTSPMNTTQNDKDHRNSISIEPPANASIQAEVKDTSPPADMEKLAPVQTGPPYSAFSTSQKRLIVFMATFSGFFSPLSGAIYFPALNSLAADLHVSDTLINLSITSYMIFQGLAPTIFGDFADQAGRRPAYIIAFSIYLAANIGLALQDSYVALVLLRCLQSGGSSATVAIGMGVIADISTTSERGSYMGLVSAGIMLGPAVGPVIGGLLAEFLGWRAIFWFLTIGTATFLIPYIIFIPETARNIIGNGSVAPQAWNRTLLACFQQRKLTKSTTHTHDPAPSPSTQDPGVLQTPVPPQPTLTRPKLRFPNPLKCLTITVEKDVSIVLIYNSLIYVAVMVVNASLPALFADIYAFNDLQIGLCYLPTAAASCIASILSGKLLDWNYRRIARNIGFPLNRKRGDDLAKYPIERARLQVLGPMLFPGLAALVGYGWALDRNASLAVPLVLQFVMGYCLTGGFSILSTLLVDLYPESPSTVTAGNNLFRCLLGAAAIAAINSMLEAMGRGWSFTFFALLCTVASPLLWVLCRWGPGWREERRARVLNRKEEKARQRGKESA
ncbi:hypothetical protein MMC19_000249 [Ptychographa xylographoides]|nr:hypothetical protein [Ptychographa xylographoides]